jgi:glutamine amidotransferase
MNKIIIPDYGSGNYASIVRMVEKAGGMAEIIHQPRPITNDEKIIMAGVGAFDNGMIHLKSTGWLEYLQDAVVSRSVPVLGICLGMQLMCLSSEEGKEKGLGWINANVIHFTFPKDSNLKVPHMGWNKINIMHTGVLFDQVQEELRYYFTHSYYVRCNDENDILATSNHGHDFVAAFRKDHILGVQFHPEKSHRFGLSVVGNFLKV